MTFASILQAAGLDPSDILVIRHSHVKAHAESGLAGIGPDSTDAEILRYTSRQLLNPQSFPADPPRYWAVFVKEPGLAARLWSVVENQGVKSVDDMHRYFDLKPTGLLEDLNQRLVIHWSSPISWKVRGNTAASYPVMEISDAAPIPFPGFDKLVLDYSKLQAVMREQRYTDWRTALASVAGIYLITDMSTGKQYVGKADGAERISQRWSTYAANGHGGNIGLRGLDPSSFRYSLLRVFDPSTPTSDIDAAESYFKEALGTRLYGLNRN